MTRTTEGIDARSLGFAASVSHALYSVRMSNIAGAPPATNRAASLGVPVVSLVSGKSARGSVRGKLSGDLNDSRSELVQRRVLSESWVMKQITGGRTTFRLEEEISNP